MPTGARLKGDTLKLEVYGELVLDDIRSVISRGDTITIKKGVKHAVRAISELTFIEVQSGNLLAEEDIEQFDYKW